MLTAEGGFAELLAADFETAWLHPGEEETLQNGKFACLN